MQRNCISLPLDLPGYRVLAQHSHQEGIIRVLLTSQGSTAICPQCGHLTSKVHDQRQRQIADEPLGQRQVTLIVLRRRFRCLLCECLFTEMDEVAGYRRRLSKRLRVRLFQEAQRQCVKAVAETYGVSPRTVQRALVEHGQPKLAEQAGTVHQLGIDEFSIRKGQRYATGLHDLQRRRLLEVVAGRASADVQAALEGLAGKEAIEVVSMDMSGAFRAAVEWVLPQAVIVVDKFHVVARVNQALREVWQRLVKSKGRDDPLRQVKWLLLARGEQLQREERERLWGVLKQYGELRRAWLLKEELRRWYRQTESVGEARLQLRAWRQMLNEEGMPGELRQLQGMLQGWGEQILNYFQYRVTQGPVEGKNNRVKAIQRQAYGFRNFANLRLRLLLAC